jgi:hypothetical protein
MRNLIATAALALAVSAGSAHAQNAVLTHYTKASVEKSLKAVGAANVQAVKVGQIDVIRFTAGQINYNLAFAVCDAPMKCRGLQMLIFFRQNQKPYQIAQVNSFNQRYAFAQAVLMPDGKLGLSRYVISDGGVTQNNLTENLKVFMAMPAQAAQHFGGAAGPGGGTEASAPPSAAATVMPAAMGVEVKDMMLLSGESQGNELQAISPETIIPIPGAKPAEAPAAGSKPAQ